MCKHVQRVKWNLIDVQMSHAMDKFFSASEKWFGQNDYIVEMLVIKNLYESKVEGKEG